MCKLGGAGVRVAGGVGRHGAAGALPLEPLRHSRLECARAAARVDSAGARPRRLPARQLPRAVRAAREPQVRPRQPPAPPGALDGGALPGGGEVARPPARPRRQVPRAQEVPAAQDHLGWRAEDSLLQGSANPHLAFLNI